MKNPGRNERTAAIFQKQHPNRSTGISSPPISHPFPFLSICHLCLFVFSMFFFFHSFTNFLLLTSLSLSLRLSFTLTVFYVRLLNLINKLLKKKWTEFCFWKLRVIAVVTATDAHCLHPTDISVISSPANSKHTQFIVRPCAWLFLKLVCSNSQSGFAFLFYFVLILMTSSL